MSSRLCKLGVATLLCMAFGAAAATACNEPDFSFSPTRAQAGDRIGYSISNTDPGATWTITVDGHGVASGTDPGSPQGVENQGFTVPDLGGSSRTVLVEATIFHAQDGADVIRSHTLDYVVPTPPSSPPSSSLAPSPAPAPSAHHPVGTPGHHHPVSGPAGAAHSVRSSGASTQASFGGGASPSSRPVGRPPGSSPPGAQSASRVEGARSAAGRSIAAQPYRLPAAAAVPGYVLLGLATALLAAIAAVFVLVRRRSGPDETGVPAVPELWTPPPLRAEADLRSAEIEAELQEMIAEERARRLLASDRPERAVERERASEPV